MKKNDFIVRLSKKEAWRWNSNLELTGEEKNLQNHIRFREMFMNNQNFSANSNFDNKENSNLEKSKVGSLLDSSSEHWSAMESYYTEKDKELNSEKSNSFYVSKESDTESIDSFEDLD